MIHFLSAQVEKRSTTSRPIGGRYHAEIEKSRAAWLRKVGAFFKPTATTLKQNAKEMEKGFAPEPRTATLEHLYMLENALVGSLGSGFEVIDNSHELDGTSWAHLDLIHKHKTVALELNDYNVDDQAAVTSIKTRCQACSACDRRRA